MGDYYANPYAYDAKGFYFDDLDEFEAGVEASGVEEFEIEYVGGDKEVGDLFGALRVGQAELDTWFDHILDLDDQEKATLYWLIEDAEYVEQLAADFGGWGKLLGENTEFYIDVDRVVRDFEIGGDISEFNFGGRTWVIRPNDF